MQATLPSAFHCMHASLLVIRAYKAVGKGHGPQSCEGVPSGIDRWLVVSHAPRCAIVWVSFFGRLPYGQPQADEGIAETHYGCQVGKPPHAANVWDLGEAAAKNRTEIPSEDSL